jgi:uncharacterized protein YjbI with pentapeptide repeats
VALCSSPVFCFLGRRSPLKPTSFAGTRLGFTPEQLYSTASYQQRNLKSVILSGSDFSGWDFSGQDLSGADFWGVETASPSNLTDASLSGAILRGTSLGAVNLTRADLVGANLMNASLWTSTLEGADLTGAILYSSTFIDSDLTEAILANAYVSDSNVANASFAGASLKNAFLGSTENVESAFFDSTTAYSQWTVFPEGFDPVAAGLTLVPSMAGDPDADGVLSVADVDNCRFPRSLSRGFLAFLELPWVICRCWNTHV